MKKVFNLFIIMSLIFSLGACSIPSGNTGSKTDDTTIENNEESKNDDLNDENTSDEEKIEDTTDDANDEDTTDAEDFREKLQEQLDNSIVYVTKSGSCYHRRNCSTLSRSKTIYSMTRKEAKSKGYTSCSKCKS